MTVFDLYKDEIIEIYKQEKTKIKTYEKVKKKYNITLTYDSFRYFFKTRIKDVLAYY